ncbi:competence/damage-inducible protein A [Planctomycetota bacterium]
MGNLSGHAAQRAQQVAIVAVGDELTEGRIDNTNASWLSRRLWALGLEVVAHVSVPDDPKLMRRAFREATEVAGIVLVSGGLGPTADDLTRDVAAELAGVELDLHAPSLARIEAIFRTLGREMTPNNRCQALFPVGSVVLPNDRGTAPGFRLETAGATFFFLPGVPRELRHLCGEHVEPYLRDTAAGYRVVRSHQLTCFGLAESKIDALLTTAALPKEVRLSLNVSQGVISLYLSASGSSADAVEERLAQATSAARAALGSSCFSMGGASLAEVVLERCRELSVRLAFAESCTGGLATHLVSRVPGASEVLLGGVNAYANAVKEDLLGVSHELLLEHGAVSEEVALAMAEGVARATGADLAAAVTGIAGPGGGTSDKPVGTVFVAVTGDRKLRGTRSCRRLQLAGERYRIQLLAALSALDLVRRSLPLRS